MNTIKKIFDKRCVCWGNDYSFNERLLQSQKNYFNDILRARGFVFLRDIYECLGLEVTRESCEFGWIRGSRENVGFVNFDYCRIANTSNFELTFKCYPILECLEVENGIGE